MEDKDSESHSIELLEEPTSVASVTRILFNFLKDFVCYSNFEYKGGQGEKK